MVLFSVLKTEKRKRRKGFVKKQKGPQPPERAQQAGPGPAQHPRTGPSLSPSLYLLSPTGGPRR